ncbi:UNVERIFIED_CONTAM: hypothetical protein RMT77_003330 [Armadillidium vulgare]
MLNRFKTALYNVVGNFDPTDGGSINNLGTVSLSTGVQNIPSVIRQNSIQGKEKTLKFPYTRPHFLQLNSEDEILVTADHSLRPIICPRDISRLPWNSGYAETVNAGKSKRNEDQAAVHVGLLTRAIKPSSHSSETNNAKNNAKVSINKKPSIPMNGMVQNNVNGIDVEKWTSGLEEEDKKSLSGTPFTPTLQNGAEALQETLKLSLETKVEISGNVISIPYYYFGVFDGHAGWGAAVSAANQLHHIIHEKLCDVIELIIPDSYESNLSGPLWSSEKMVSPDSAIIGALEQAFWTMDQLIGEDRQKHYLSGGCTACVALFILGKVFVSNAGDSRGVIGFQSNPVPMSFDFTPETETQRIRKLGARHPELLGGEFTHLEFLRRPLRSDIGKKAPFRDHYMKGWGLKTITEADLKYPLVCGEGKRSRVLATIGVTRGFGDHDLKAQFSSLPIKPFLSAEPEVRVFDLNKFDVTNEDVLILGTDGLWDIMSNEKAVTIVSGSLKQFSEEDSHKYKYRYTSAAHDLVLWSRGRFREHQWRTSDDKHATIDDISAFVIPLNQYKIEFKQWQKDMRIPSNLGIAVDPSEEVIVPLKGQSYRKSVPINHTDSAREKALDPKGETVRASMTDAAISSVSLSIDLSNSSKPMDSCSPVDSLNIPKKESASLLPSFIETPQSNCAIQSDNNQTKIKTVVNDCDSLDVVTNSCNFVSVKSSNIEKNDLDSNTKAVKNNLDCDNDITRITSSESTNNVQNRISDSTCSNTVNNELVPSSSDNNTLENSCDHVPDIDRNESGIDDTLNCNSNKTFLEPAKLLSTTASKDNDQS